MTHATFLATLALLTIACAATPPAPTEQQQPVAATSEPSQADTRADALLADMERREAAYKKEEAALADADRRRKIPVQTIAPTAAPSSAPAAPQTAAPIQTAAPVGTSSYGGHDEAWWKNETRTAEVKLADDRRRLQEAIDQQSMASGQMGIATRASPVVFAQAQEAFNKATAEVQRLQGEVRNDIAAVDRVREDARKADVPPGWLRWP